MFQAQFCARGDQQIQAINFFETYAPVVQWTMICLMLILEVLLELKSKQWDITAAFLHANWEEGENIFVKMPLSFWKKDKLLKLKKTLCGLCHNPYTFWKYLVEKLEACGMSQSKLDPYLFTGEKVTRICYFDDLLL